MAPGTRRLGSRFWRPAPHTQKAGHLHLTEAAGCRRAAPQAAHSSPGRARRGWTGQQRPALQPVKESWAAATTARRKHAASSIQRPPASRTTNRQRLGHSSSKLQQGRPASAGSVQGRDHSGSTAVGCHKCVAASLPPKNMLRGGRVLSDGKGGQEAPKKDAGTSARGRWAQACREWSARNACCDSNSAGWKRPGCVCQKAPPTRRFAKKGAPAEVCPGEGQVGANAKHVCAEERSRTAKATTSLRGIQGGKTSEEHALARYEDIESCDKLGGAESTNTGSSPTASSDIPGAPGGKGLICAHIFGSSPPTQK